MTASTGADFDVVIPAHDAAATVSAAVRSALAQSLPPVTVTVVADNCSDDTAQLAAAAGARVVTSTRGSPGGARNVGIASGQARWIAFLDADDLWQTGWLAAVDRTIADHPEVDLCYGTVAVVDAAGADIGGLEPRRPSGDLFAALLRDSLITTSAVAVRRRALVDANGFDEHYLEAEDYDLWLRLAERCRFCPVYGRHVVYRRVPHSAMRSPQHHQRIRDQGLAIVRAALMRRPVSAALQRQAEAHILRESAERLLADDQVAAARGDLRSALMRTPGDRRLWAMAMLSVLPQTARHQALAWRRSSRAALARLVALVHDGLSKNR